MAEKSGYYPTLTGSLAYAYSASSDGWNFDEDNNAWILGFNLSVPIFSGGATRARVQRARIDLNKSRIGIAQARDDIRKEIRSTRLRLDEAHSRITSAAAALKTARKAFEIADATAGSGLTTQLELKDSRVMLDQATVRYAGAIFDYLVAYFDWQLVIGQVAQPGGAN